MWREIARFEVAHHVRQPIFSMSAIVILLLSAVMVSTDVGVELSDAPSSTNHNTPMVIVNLLTIMSVLGLFVITAFVVSSALRDFESGTHMLFFSKPIRKLDYLMGRFAGSMVVCLLLFLLSAVGIAMGRFLPWEDPERLGPFTLYPFLYGLIVVVLPNLLMMGMLFFAVAIWSRRPLVPYICVVVFWCLQDAVEEFAGRLGVDNAWSGLIEPLGFGALDAATRYWTVVEYNTALPEIGGILAYNRLLWMGVGLAFLGLGYLRFSYSRAAGRRAKRELTPRAPDERIDSVSTRIRLPRATRRFSVGTALRQLWHQTRLETGEVMSGTAFFVLLVLGVMFIAIFAWFIGENRGTPIFPMTHLMLRGIQLGMQTVLVIILVFFCGELIWRERSRNLDGVNDALPVPSWVFLGAKFLALVAVIGIFVGTGVLTTVCVQLLRGFHDLEPGLYARGALVVGWPFVIFAAVALFLQVVARNKHLGFLMMILLMVGRIVLRALGFDHSLYRYGAHSPIPYSDMNGYGHFVERFVCFNLYWSLAAAILLAVALLFWSRGTPDGLRVRLAVARSRLRGPLRAFLAVAVLCFIGIGAYIFYNTNVLNEYVSGREGSRLQAEYEKKYRRYLDVPQPRITRIYAEVDIFPEERRLEIRGSYYLENKTAESIPALHVGINPSVTIHDMNPGDHVIALDDPDFGYHIYDLAAPLPPGESLELAFDLSVACRGFANGDEDASVSYALLRNGTFFNHRQFFPQLGYDATVELVDRNRRRKHDLPPPRRIPLLDDLAARRNTYIATDADWIDFETIVSTCAGQIAIAPGYPQREWEENGRRYFHYKTESPILNFISYQSADYTVRRDHWRDVDIEVYYHAPHHYNVDRMIEATKKSLDYYSTHFGPYRHRQLRIIEFPGYQHFAQSFANTVPFSETAGFITRVGKGGRHDLVFNITAHEVAHQWWAHQVIGANVQGATMLSESLAEYSALMVMEQEYGPDRMRDFLEYELDQYLQGRGDETLYETPLMLVEDQRYIHYNKGCLAMYALRDYIGEEQVNRALSRYVEKVAFQEPPYTNTPELLACLREETPDSLAYVLEDLFETITLFSNRTSSATYTPLDDGRYRVDLVVEAKKLRADGQGIETEIAIDDWIDIGIFGETEVDGRTTEGVLYLKKHHIDRAETRIELIVDERPLEAGIDPYHKLIDRSPEDNVRKAEGDAS